MSMHPRLPSPPAPRRRRPWDPVARRLARADERLFAELVGRRSAVADHALSVLSRAANDARLWFATAAALSLWGGPRGRRAAARGLVAIGLASAIANGPLKHTWRRRRPSIAVQLPPRGLLTSPRSHSFPSGHAASASAFATAVSAELPGVVALPLNALALAVAYSRVHTGVHYPGDVLGGAVVGIAAGLASGRLLDAAEVKLAAVAADVDPAIPREAVLVTSPHAGRAHRLGAARRAMAQFGVQVLAEVPIEQADELDDLIARAGRRPLLIVAAGGDGTVGAAADHVANNEAVLGVLPLGTSNDFARSLGIPVDPLKAARLFAVGKVSTVDAGRLVVPGRPPRHFVHAATAGLSVSFAKLATKASMRHRFGRLTYAAAAAVALREPESFACELRYDGHVDRHELVHLAVINAPVFGGFLGMRIPGAGVDDHALDVIAVERLPVRRLLLAALHPILGLRRPIRGLHVLRLPAVRVHTDRELDLALDGEVLGRIPADFEAAGEALRVITPRDFNARVRFRARPLAMLREKRQLLGAGRVGP